MTTDQILSLDMRDAESAEKLQKALKKIKPFSKEEGKVRLELIEKFLLKICRKYVLKIQYIMPSMLTETMYYSLSVKRDDTHEWQGSVYGMTIYEVFAKAAVLLYSKVKKENIPERVLK